MDGFAELWAGAQADIDDTLAEDFAFTPMVAGTLVPATPDATRAPVPSVPGTFTAAWERPSRHPATPYESAVGSRADLVGASGQGFCVSIWLADVGGRVARKDLFTRLKTGEVFEVWDIHLSGAGRADCLLEAKPS